MKKILILLFSIILLSSCFFYNEELNPQFIKKEYIIWEYNLIIDYPSEYSEYWKDLEVFSGACENNNLSEISNFLSDLNNYNLENTQTENIFVNWNKYLKFILSDAWAGHLYNSYYYSIKNNNECIVLKFATDLLNCENYLPLEDWNLEQKISYDKCIFFRENNDNIISDLEENISLEK